MYMRTLPLLLICGISTTASATTAFKWSCFAADGALERKQQVELGMLPKVVFAGESQAASVETRMANHKVPAFSVAAIHDGKLDWSAAWG